MNANRLKTSIIAVSIALQPVIAFAKEEGGHEAGFNYMEWFWKVVNFGILFFVLAKFFGPMLKDFLAKRSAAIEKTLNEAQEARRLAEEALRQVEDRIKNKEKEIDEIISSARISGQKEKEALILEGQRMSGKILEQAKTNIEFELKQAKEAVRGEAVELAMELAEKKIKDRMNQPEQARLIEESLSKLEGTKV